jgi:hypothetical protein
MERCPMDRARTYLPETWAAVLALVVATLVVFALAASLDPSEILGGWMWRFGR